MKSKAGWIIFILLIMTSGSVSMNQSGQLRTRFYQSMHINPNSGKTPRNPLVMVLSFDYEDLTTDSGTKNLPSIFQILEKHDAKATFFILGKAAEKNPSAVKEIYVRGHSLGLHTSTHHFPIFTRDDASEIEEVYKTELDYVWDRSFKTPEIFYEDLEKNKKYVTNAIGDNIELKMFRSPSLVVNWTTDQEYFSTLKKAGIKIDSSAIRESTDKEPVYLLYGIIEVPVSVSETSLFNVTSLNIIVEGYSKDSLPFVMYIHPQKLGSNDLIIFDEFLSSLEEEYDVTYLMVDEVPTYYGTS
ncbi:MAG: polysaccharide deacetylase family protein [Candidatus Hydrothermarchaeales archaeon]